MDINKRVRIGRLNVGIGIRRGEFMKYFYEFKVWVNIDDSKVRAYRLLKKGND